VAALEAARDYVALVQLLRRGDAAGKEAAANALGRLANVNNNANQETIVEAGAVAPLVELLRRGDEAGKTAAALALGRLAFNNDANQEAIVKAGAVAPLEELKRCGDAAGKTEAEYALKWLARKLPRTAGESTTHPAERVRP
jgi:hypothetical protein